MTDATLESAARAGASAKRRLRVLSGMQPTGRMHLGNYLGALRSWVRLQDDHECVFFVADYHSLTTVTDPSTLRPAISELVLDWLAAGVDPERSTVFLQSDVPEVAELHQLLSMTTPLGWLERVPSYKERAEQFPDNVNYGLLGYPVLQAADILLPRPRRRGPGAPHRADPGDRAPLQPPFWTSISRTAGDLHRDPSGDGDRRGHQDEQEPGQHHRHARQPRGDPAGGDEHGHRCGAAGPDRLRRGQAVARRGDLRPLRPDAGAPRRAVGAAWAGLGRPGRWHPPGPGGGSGDARTGARGLRAGPGSGGLDSGSSSQLLGSRAKAMAKHGVRFAPGTMVSPGEYRNTETGQVRYFDGSTPLPGKVNAASWQQISDHYHAGERTAPPRHHMPDEVSSRSQGVRFAPGMVVSPGEYRNTETGEVRYFDGNSPLPGKANAASWQQISDHFHAESGHRP